MFAGTVAAVHLPLAMLLFRVVARLLMLQFFRYARVVGTIITLIVAVLAPTALLVAVTRATVVAAAVVITTFATLLQRHIGVTQEFGPGTPLTLGQLALLLLFCLLAANVIERVDFTAGSTGILAFTHLCLLKFLLNELVKVLEDARRNLDLRALGFRGTLDVPMLAALDAANVA